MKPNLLARNAKVRDERDARRSEASSLKKGFSWSFAGNLANVASQFGILLLLTRLGTADDVGNFGLGLAITAPIFLLAGMSLRTLFVTSSDTPTPFSHFLAVRLVGMFLSIAAVGMIAALFRYPFQVSFVLILIGLSKAIEGVSDIIYGVFQRDERMDIIARSMIVRAVATVVVVFVLMWLTQSLIWSLVGMCLVWMTRLVFYDIRYMIRTEEGARARTSIVRYLRGRGRADAGDYSEIWALVRVSIPVGLAVFLISLNTNAPRYVLERTNGTSELAVFTVIAYPLVAGNVVMSAIAQSSLPRLNRYSRSGDVRAFQKLLRKMLLLSSGLAVLALVLATTLGDTALRVGFGSLYASEGTAFTILVLGMGIGFANWSLNAAMQAKQQFRRLLDIQIIALVTSIILAFILIPEFGVLGAAWTIVASTLVQAVAKSTVLTKGLPAASEKSI